ncbi:cucumber peeling cupredoxin-like [Euphorbia lathyris]|uniref:cucumber peeling cupredoxin-like n=1 Tax=Euphorbia lathyris TaxID=212925 RepID=UPI003313E328
MARFISIMGVSFGFLMVVLFPCTAAQTVHVVGDNIGWTVPSNGAVAYVNWANGKNFVVGDVLSFNFVSTEHDVLRVEKTSFDACTASNAIGDVITTGPVNITLEGAGEHYYICTFSQHCQFGQKLAISVSTTLGASPPSTTPRPPTTPIAPSADCPTSDPPTTKNSPTGSMMPSPPNSSSSIITAGIYLSTLILIISFLL